VWLSRFRFVDPQSPAGNGGVAQATDGSLRFPWIRHGDKAKAAWTTGLTIRDEFDGFNLPIGFEELTQVVSGGGERNVSNVDVHALFLLRVGHQRQPIQAVA
jgi:hypothetical protein